jgi:hypothetical protein
MNARDSFQALLNPWLSLDLSRFVASLVVLAIIVLPGGIPMGAIAYGLLAARRGGERHLIADGSF